jgi:hypothetical protein
MKFSNSLEWKSRTNHDVLQLPNTRKPDENVPVANSFVPKLMTAESRVVPGHFCIVTARASCNGNWTRVHLVSFSVHSLAFMKRRAVAVVNLTQTLVGRQEIFVCGENTVSSTVLVDPVPQSQYLCVHQSMCCPQERSQHDTLAPGKVDRSFKTLGRIFNSLCGFSAVMSDVCNWISKVSKVLNVVCNQFPLLGL